MRRVRSARSKKWKGAGMLAVGTGSRGCSQRLLFASGCIGRTTDHGTLDPPLRPGTQLITRLDSTRSKEVSRFSVSAGALVCRL